MDQEHATLGERHYLTDGGQSTIYRLPSLHLPDLSGPLIYKEYRPEVGLISLHGLRSVVRFRDQLLPKQQAWLDAVTAWPLRIVVDRGVVRGVIMREIPVPFQQEIQLTRGRAESRPRTAQFLFVERAKVERVGMRFSSRGDRLIICSHLAYILAFLHKRDITFGDISGSNVLFSLEPKPGVMLVDCDAVRKRGTAAIVGQLHTPDWEPPGTESAVQSIATDLYKLGLFIRRSLAPGPGASVAVDTEALNAGLDPAGITLLRRALRGPSTGRPTAREWHAYLREAVSGQR